MSAKPRFDAAALMSVLGRSRVPRALSIEGRVTMIAEVAAALLADRLPSREAGLFVAGALQAWLENGGDFSRDYLRVVRAKSHRTASKIWQAIQEQAEAHPDEGGDPSSAE